MVAGSGIGSGLGELLRQGTSGKEYDVGKLAGETGIGALGGGLGVLLGGALRAGRVGGAALGSADEAGNLLARGGKALTKGVTKPYALQAAKTGPRFASEADEVAKFLTKYTGSPAAKGAKMGAEYDLSLIHI